MPRRPFGPPRNDREKNDTGQKESGDDYRNVGCALSGGTAAHARTGGNSIVPVPPGVTFLFRQESNQRSRLKGPSPSSRSRRVPLKNPPAPLYCWIAECFRLTRGRNLNCCRHDTGRNRDAECALPHRACIIFCGWEKFAYVCGEGERLSAECGRRKLGKSYKIWPNL